MIENDMFTITILPLNYFVLFTNFSGCLNCSSVQFPLADVVTAMDVMPCHWAFYFLHSGLHFLSCRIWAGSLCNVHVALQKVQAATLILHLMAFRAHSG